MVFLHSSLLAGLLHFDLNPFHHHLGTHTKAQVILSHQKSTAHFFVCDNEVFIDTLHTVEICQPPEETACISKRRKMPCNINNSALIKYHGPCGFWVRVEAINGGQLYLAEKYIFRIFMRNRICFRNTK